MGRRSKATCNGPLLNEGVGEALGVCRSSAYWLAGLGGDAAGLRPRVRDLRVSSSRRCLLRLNPAIEFMS
jgi:hypothetical protein